MEKEWRGDYCMSANEGEIVTERMGDNPPTEGIEEQGENRLKPEEGESFQALYEESLQEVQEGEVVHGRVIHIGPEFVTVDIGFKSEGQVALREFLSKDGSPIVSIRSEEHTS